MGFPPALRVSWCPSTPPKWTQASRPLSCHSLVPHWVPLPPRLVQGHCRGHQPWNRGQGESRATHCRERVTVASGPPYSCPHALSCPHPHILIPVSLFLPCPRISIPVPMSPSLFPGPSSCPHVPFPSLLLCPHVPTSPSPCPHPYRNPSLCPHPHVFLPVPMSPFPFPCPPPLLTSVPPVSTSPSLCPHPHVPLPIPVPWRTRSRSPARRRRALRVTMVPVAAVTSASRAVTTPASLGATGDRGDMTQGQDQQ